MSGHTTSDNNNSGRNIDDMTEQPLAHVVRFCHWCFI